MDFFNDAGRDTGIIGFVSFGLDSGLCLELAVEFLQPVGGQGLDRKVPDIGKDVVMDPIEVAGEGSF